MRPPEFNSPWPEPPSDAVVRSAFAQSDLSKADYFRQLYQRVFHSERGEGPRCASHRTARVCAVAIWAHACGRRRTAWRGSAAP